MAKENLSVSLPPKMRSLLEREAKRGKRSRSAVVREALQLYFQLRQIGVEEASEDDRAAIVAGRQAYKQGDLVSLNEWRNAVGLVDH